jgi:hypothetical protein
MIRVATTSFLFAAITFSTIAPVVSLSQTPARSVVDFNNHWKFIEGDEPGAAQATFDDSKWQSVTGVSPALFTRTIQAALRELSFRPVSPGIGRHFLLPKKMRIAVSLLFSMESWPTATFGSMASTWDSDQTAT